jgi:hypothetical protein
MHGLSSFDAFLYGLGGGLVPELVALYKMRQQPQLPQWIRSWIYWLPTVAMIAAGGGLAAAYASSGSQIGPILALNIGASAPLILGSLSSAAPDITPGRIG